MNVYQPCSAFKREYAKIVMYYIKMVYELDLSAADNFKAEFLQLNKIK